MAKKSTPYIPHGSTLSLLNFMMTIMQGIIRAKKTETKMYKIKRLNDLSALYIPLFPSTPKE